MSFKTIDIMSVEEFMEGVKAIITKHGSKKIPEAIDEVLVDAYNEYRDRVRNGESIGELLPFFKKIGNKIGEMYVEEVRFRGTPGRAPGTLTIQIEEEEE